ncbi:hypothetical protein AABB24_012602 [Solanum stoloniferum]|uniref:Uncharacterized protein n=1 Tax=Solanum stoloniferum TaxID=62892 RepID=A0ABD2U3M5_9SOLN
MEINDLGQGNPDITFYYTRMKKLWKELNTLCVKSNCSCLCTCSDKDTMHKAGYDRKLIQFIMGLNDIYTIIRESMLMKNHLPSMGQTFSLLVQEEKQREFKPNSQIFAEFSSLNVFSSGASSSSGAFLRNLCGSSDFQNFQTNYTNSGTKTRLLCDYYKRLGHIKDKCYKIDGYPNNSGLNNQSYTNHAQRNQQNNFNPNSQNIGYKGKGIVTNVHGDLHASYSNERSQVNT